MSILGDALVETNAAISADALGYNSTNHGPGAGQVATNGDGGGGGYGGAGGESAGGASGGAAYGWIQDPVLRGSQGGVVLDADPNLSQGGGVVSLRVGGTLTVNGKVSANGSAGLFPGAGGGAGGGVLLAVGTLAGQGVTSANGGAGQGNLGGGGGGGRLAIYFRTNAFAGETTVSGGAGFASGQSGTLYTSTNLPPLVLARESFPPPIALAGSVVPSGASLNLTWIGSGGVSYQAEISRDLTHWQPCGPPIISSNGPNSLLLPLGLDSGTFLRLVLAN